MNLIIPSLHRAEPHPRQAQRYYPSGMITKTFGDGDLLIQRTDPDNENILFTVQEQSELRIELSRDLRCFEGYVLIHKCPDDGIEIGNTSIDEIVYGLGGKKIRITIEEIKE